MKRRAVIAWFAVVICIAIAGIWIWQEGKMVDSMPPAAPEGSEFTEIHSVNDMLEYHDTVVLVWFERNSEVYHREGDRSESWYVDTTYTVKETLRGDLQVGDTVTVQEPVTSETATPYSRKVRADGPEGTLLFLKKEGNGYHISTPKLSMHPVCFDSEWNRREIDWLDGTGRTKLEGTDQLITGITRWYPYEGKDQYFLVQYLAELSSAIQGEEQYIPDLLKEPQAIVWADLEKVEDIIQAEDRNERKLTFRVTETARGDWKPGDTLVLRTYKNGEYETIRYRNAWEGSEESWWTRGAGRVLLLRWDEGEWKLWNTPYDSVHPIDDHERIDWFRFRFDKGVTGGIRYWKEVVEYCQEGENK